MEKTDSISPFEKGEKGLCDSTVADQEEGPHTRARKDARLKRDKSPREVGPTSYVALQTKKQKPPTNPGTDEMAGVCWGVAAYGRDGQ